MNWAFRGAGLPPVSCSSIGLGWDVWSQSACGNPHVTVLPFYSEGPSLPRGQFLVEENVQKQFHLSVRNLSGR